MSKKWEFYICPQILVKLKNKLQMLDLPNECKCVLQHNYWKGKQRERLIADSTEYLWCVDAWQTLAGGGVGWDRRGRGGTIIQNMLLAMKIHIFAQLYKNIWFSVLQKTQWRRRPHFSYRPHPHSQPHPTWNLTSRVRMCCSRSSTYPIEFNNDESRRLLVFRRWEAGRGCFSCQLASWNTTRFNWLAPGHVFAIRRGNKSIAAELFFCGDKGYYRAPSCRIRARLNYQIHVLWLITPVLTKILHRFRR